MTATYDCIATTTTTGTATITWNSIPATYTDLVIICAGRETQSGGGYVTCRFNNDSGSNYSRTILRGNGSTASSVRASNDTAVYFNLVTDTAVAIANIMNYSNTTTFKTTIHRHNDVTDTVGITASLWRSTSAISRIDLTSVSSGNTLVGTYTLYGIKAE